MMMNLESKLGAVLLLLSVSSVSGSSDTSHTNNWITKGGYRPGDYVEWTPEWKQLHPDKRQAYLDKYVTKWATTGSGAFKNSSTKNPLESGFVPVRGRIEKFANNESISFLGIEWDEFAEGQEQEATIKFDCTARGIKMSKGQKVKIIEEIPWPTLEYEIEKRNPQRVTIAGTDDKGSFETKIKKILLSSPWSKKGIQGSTGILIHYKDTTDEGIKAFRKCATRRVNTDGIKRWQSKYSREKLKHYHLRCKKINHRRERPLYKIVPSGRRRLARARFLKRRRLARQARFQRARW